MLSRGPLVLKGTMVWYEGLLVDVRLSGYTMNGSSRSPRLGSLWWMLLRHCAAVHGVRITHFHISGLFTQQR